MKISHQHSSSPSISTTSVQNTDNLSDYGRESDLGKGLNGKTLERTSDTQESQADARHFAKIIAVMYTSNPSCIRPHMGRVSLAIFKIRQNQAWSCR
jgi:hypothetical protein